MSVSQNSGFASRELRLGRSVLSSGRPRMHRDVLVYGIGGVAHSGRFVSELSSSNGAGGPSEIKQTTLPHTTFRRRSSTQAQGQMEDAALKDQLQDTSIVPGT
jgi:hypothetical protein